MRLPGLGEFDCLQPVDSLADSKAARFEHESGDSPIVLDIVGNEHADFGMTVAKHADGPERGDQLDAGVVRGLEGERELECRPLVAPALHGDIAVHESSKLAADTQPKTRAVSQSSTGVGLLEGLENRGEIALLDPATSVGNPDDDVLSVAARVQRNLARLSEFDRVANEVDHDLPDAFFVRDDHVGNVVGDVQMDGNLFLDELGLEHVDAFFERIPEREGYGENVDPARFDLGHIEHFVDQFQEVSTASANRPDILPLFVAEAGVSLQHLRVAENCVHRRANLMRHRREENALRTVRGLREVSCIAQLELKMLELVNVHRHTEAEQAFAFLVTLRRHGEIPHPVIAAVMRPVPVLGIQLLGVSLEPGDPLRLKLVAVVRVHERQEFLAPVLRRTPFRPD